MTSRCVLGICRKSPGRFRPLALRRCTPSAATIPSPHDARRKRAAKEFGQEKQNLRSGVKTFLQSRAKQKRCQARRCEMSDDPRFRQPSVRDVKTSESGAFVGSFRYASAQSRFLQQLLTRSVKVAASSAEKQRLDQPLCCARLPSRGAETQPTAPFHPLAVRYELTRGRSTRVRRGGGSELLPRGTGVGTTKVAAKRGATDYAPMSKSKTRRLVESSASSGRRRGRGRVEGRGSRRVRVSGKEEEEAKGTGDSTQPRPGPASRQKNRGVSAADLCCASIFSHPHSRRQSEPSACSPARFRPRPFALLSLPFLMYDTSLLHRQRACSGTDRGCSTTLQHRRLAGVARASPATPRSARPT